MKRSSFPWVLLTLLPAAPLAGQDHDHAASPYAQDRSEIAALSVTELAQLRAGEGMGLARAAELNSYPGPKHLLEMADHLGLSAEQVKAVEVIRDQMLEEAVALGEQVIEAERGLDRLFVDGSIEAETMERSLEEIARLSARLRAAHVRAHLRVSDLLSETQIEMYDRMRGYR